MSAMPQRPEETVEFPAVGMTGSYGHLKRVIGTKLRSVRAGCALDCGAISLARHCTHSFLLDLSYIYTLQSQETASSVPGDLQRGSTGEERRAQRGTAATLRSLWVYGDGIPNKLSLAMS